MLQSFQLYQRNLRKEALSNDLLARVKKERPIQYLIGRRFYEVEF